VAITPHGLLSIFEKDPNFYDKLTESPIYDPI